MGNAITGSSISDLLKEQKNGTLSAVEIVTAYLEQIARYDKSGPCINAVLELNPDALAIAAGLDTIRRSGQKMGTLHGIPILLKDNINTGDKLHTSAGSLALAGSHAPEDAYLVKKLRDAGAVILGKANMTEWANFMTKGMPNGYSSRGGQVKNPYGTGLDPGGSSSGSAAAVAAGFCSAAVGTETSGSILSPAIQNMLVGIKPTVGLVSRSGIIPISHSQDTAGPLAKTVTDAALLLLAMRGVDCKDPATGPSANQLTIDYTKHLGKTIQGLRIGVPRKGFYDKLTEPELESIRETLKVLSEAGAEIVDPADFTNVDEMKGSRTMIHEFKNGINAYLASLGSAVPVKNLEEIMDFNKANRKKALRYGQTILQESQYFSSGTLTDPEYIRSRFEDLRICKTEGIDALLSEHNLDLLLFPAYYGCAVAARAGYPSITIPTGMVDSPEGLKPFGAALTGPAFSEALLVQCAYALEQRTLARRPPELD